MLKLNDKYIFYFDPNDYCDNLKCSTCGGRIWLGDWEDFATQQEADLDQYLVPGDEIGLYWDTNDEDDKIWYKQGHIKPEEVSFGYIALKDDRGHWYATEGFIDEPQ